MKKIALLILYNHRYDKNIARLEDIYKGRFTHIFHIMPFYDGNIENVIPVYESSYHFSSYISQAYTHLKGKGFTHFFFVADDMIINPILNERNLFDESGLGVADCYLAYLHILQKLDWRWYQLRAMKYKVRQRGVEIENLLPSRKEAERQLAKYGIPYSAIPLRPLLSWHLEYLFIYLKNFSRRKPDYPLVGGYADIILVTAEVMEKFVLYCGIFAATKLFVEIAIPTALALSTDNLKTSADIKLKQGALWTDEDKAFLEKYECDLGKLVADYPKDTFFIHPIKLSKWK